MKAQTILAIVSSLALAISLVSLWQSHLARFRPVAVAGPLKLRIAHIESKGETWYLPQVDCMVTVTNAGAKIGRVLGIRMVARYPKLPIPGAQETFRANFEVDPALYRKHEGNRFTWIRESQLGHPTPFVLLARSSVSKHIVFDTRWEDPVIQEVEFTLELLTDRAKKWITVESWTHEIGGTVWSQLTEVGTSMMVHPKSEGPQHFAPEPTNLHDYTMGKKKIPKGGFKSAPSRLVTHSETARKEGRNENRPKESPE
ncbi:hypothetical protein OH805_27345 [Streptomyces sp. NBC_00879]|uniref:hypothetical protein n=1 Tax=Streptomyces sp. NBC_00879 TaxID=2975855 RepID=UPI0038649C61|nr:hypothetical protein OH805_27345 [Streptomyces sp. NBC_00879]